MACPGCLMEHSSGSGWGVHCAVTSCSVDPPGPGKAPSIPGPGPPPLHGIPRGR